MDKTSLWV